MIVDKIKKREPTAKRKGSKIDIPIGKWIKCEKCKEIIYKETLRENLSICPNCGHYFRMHINKRLELIIDEGTYKKFDLNIETNNPLGIEAVSYTHLPVRFEQGIKTMLDKGVDTFIEVGPGKSLSGFVKRSSRDVKILNINDITSFENTIKVLKGE